MVLNNNDFKGEVPPSMLFAIFQLESQTSRLIQLFENRSAVLLVGRLEHVSSLSATS